MLTLLVAQITLAMFVVQNERLPLFLFVYRLQVSSLCGRTFTRFLWRVYPNAIKFFECAIAFGGTTFVPWTQADIQPSQWFTDCGSEAKWDPPTDVSPHSVKRSPASHVGPSCPCYTPGRLRMSARRRRFDAPIRSQIRDGKIRSRSIRKQSQHGLIRPQEIPRSKYEHP